MLVAKSPHPLAWVSPNIELPCCRRVVSVELPLTRTRTLDLKYKPFRRVATYRKLRKVSSRVPKKKKKKKKAKKRKKKRKETKQKKGCPVREKRWSSWKRNVSLLKCKCTHVALLESPTVMFAVIRQARDRDRPCATLRISLNPVTTGQASFKICVFCRSTLLLSRGLRVYFSFSLCF